MSTCKGKTSKKKDCSKKALENGYCKWHQPLVGDANTPIEKCKQVTKRGSPCQNAALFDGFCHIHGEQRECPVCTRNVREPALPCGHWVHKKCVQKSSDSLQEIRSRTGHPPLRLCQCPVCRQDIEGMPVEQITTIFSGTSPSFRLGNNPLREFIVNMLQNGQQSATIPVPFTTIPLPLNTQSGTQGSVTQQPVQTIGSFLVIDII